MIKYLYKALFETEGKKVFGKYTGVNTVLTDRANLACFWYANLI